MKIKHRIAYEVIYETEDSIVDIDDIDDDQLLEFSESFINPPTFSEEGLKGFKVNVTISETFGEME